MTKFHAVLSPSKYPNGRLREWIGEAEDWDDAIEKAEAANPGWSTTSCGEYVEGASIFG